MAYTTINKSTDYFNTKTYTGNGSTQSITGVGFQPDWVWFKIRNTTGEHRVFDAVRGTEARLYTDGTQAEAYPDTGTLTSFDSDGFSVGNSDVNINGSSQIAWNWKANGQGSANSDGTITTTYTSANTTSGFSIVKYTGNGSSGATVGHGLGSAPKMIILKKLNGATDWFVYHDGVGATKYLSLNDTDAAVTTAAAWNDTAPSSSVFTLGNGSDLNGSSDNFIAYCFAEKTGFSKFGKYSGNVNVNGPFIYTGFKPAWVMIKCIGLANQSWTIFNNGLDPFNEMTNTLQANTNAAEDGNTTYNDVDFLSNGIKIREDNDNINATGQDYIYMAFAEAPIVGTNNIPATAR